MVNAVPTLIPAWLATGNDMPPLLTKKALVIVVMLPLVYVTLAVAVTVTESVVSTALYVMLSAVLSVTVNAATPLALVIAVAPLPLLLPVADRSTILLGTGALPALRSVTVTVTGFPTAIVDVDAATVDALAEARTSPAGCVTTIRVLDPPMTGDSATDPSVNPAAPDTDTNAPL